MRRPVAALLVAGALAVPQAMPALAIPAASTTSATPTGSTIADSSANTANTAASAAGLTGRQPGAAALDRVAACFNERRHLAVLGLVDQSTSLRSTDPDARRVDALVGMLRMLTRYGRTAEGGRSGTVEVMLSGFGTRYVPGEWTTLNEAAGTELERRAHEFAGRNGDNDTDFAAALLGAQSELIAKDKAVTATGERPPCRLLLLFTDGRYELGTRIERPYAPEVPASNLAAIEDRGRHFLCDPGQLADQLRAAATVILAIGLLPDTPGRDGPPDQTFLQAIAERAAPGRTCGESTATPGRYVAATGLDQLLAVFDQAIALALNGTPVGPGGEVGVCAAATGPVDPACTRTFHLDPALSEFHMLLNLSTSAIEAVLRSPSGDQVRLRAGQQETVTLGGATLTSSRLAALDLVVDGSLPATSTDWVGTWTVRFVDPTGANADAVARSQIIVFGALVPVTDPAPPQFRAGEQTEFTIRIVDSAGSPRTPADFVREATVTAVMIDHTGRRTPVSVDPAGPDGSRRARYLFPDDTTATYADLSVTLDVVTGSGLRLQPRSTTYRVPVRQPSAYPTLAPPELLLTPIIETGWATGTITVTGGAGGTGCVWFDRVEFAGVPAGSGPFTTRFEPAATSAQSCVRVGARQQVAVTIAVAPERVRSGLADGVLSVVLSTDGEPDRAVRLPVRFELHRPVDGVDRAALFVAIVAGGVLLPLLLLWLLGRITARFANLRLLRWARFEVEVTPDAVLLAGTGEPLRAVAGPRSFNAMAESVPATRTGRFRCEALAFRRRIPVLPWTLPYALVSAGGRAVLSSVGLGRRDLSAARVAFELNGTWVFVVERDLADDDTSGVHGSLYLLVSESEIARKAAALQVAVDRDLPARVAAAAGQLRAAGSGGEPDEAGASDPEPSYVPPPTP